MNFGSPTSTGGLIGGVDPAAQSHRVGRQEQVLQQEVGLDLRAQRPDGAERYLQILVEKALLDPALDAGRAIEIAVVDNGRPGAVGLRQDVHHAVDVLPRQVDDRQEERRSRQVRQQAVGIEIGREVALALRHVQPAVEDADLGFARPRDQPLGAEARSAVGGGGSLRRK